MKVCIVGLGAIGGLMASWLGHRLAPGEVELSALARGATLDAVRKQGLQLHGAQGPVSVALRAAASAAELGTQDLVVVAVKAPALAQVAPAVQQLCAPHTRVLVAMNGVPWWFFDGLEGPCAGLRLESVDPGGAIARCIPATSVIGCVVHASGSTLAPGVVQHVGGNGLIIGRSGGGSDTQLTAVAALLTSAGFAVTESAQIQRDIWFKLWGNMTLNPISALTGATCDRILDDPLLRAHCSAVMREAQALGGAMGLPIDQEPEARHAVTRKLGAFKTSMLQDLERARPLEIDALLGSVHEIGLHLQLPTPHLDGLLGLVRLMAQQRGLYPSGETASA